VEYTGKCDGRNQIPKARVRAPENEEVYLGPGEIGDDVQFELFGQAKNANDGRCWGD